MKLRAWSFAAATTLTVTILALSLVGLAAGHFYWGPPEIPKAQGEALRPDTIVAGVRNLATLEYRARVSTALIREPQNTWSNLVFVFVGALIVARDRRIFSRVLGVALFSLGLASGLYHASLLPFWRTVDVAMMGWVIFALGLAGFSAVWNTRPHGRPLLCGREEAQVRLSVLGGGMAILAAVVRNDVRISGFKPFDSTYVTVAGVAFVFLLLIGALLGASRPPSLARLAWLAAITTAGIVCQLWDHPGGRLFQPASPIQAHAVWHVLMGVAAALTYHTFAAMEGFPAPGSPRDLNPPNTPSGVSSQ